MSRERFYKPQWIYHIKQAYRSRIIVACLGLLIATGAWWTLPGQFVLAGDNEEYGYVGGQILIHWDEDTTLDAVLDNLDDVTVLNEISPIRVALLYSEDQDVREVVTEIKDISSIVYAEPNFELSASNTIPDDADFNLQYGLISIRAPEGWDVSTGASDVVIAVLDTGVDLDHPDLMAKIVPGYDFVNGDANPDDDNGHGTMVAGVAAAVSDNNLGIAGTSWGARVMPVKVLNAGAGGSYANVAAGIVWAVDNGADVINMSLGGSTFSNIVQLSLQYAIDNGVVMMAASGNGGFNFILFPARAPEVMAVGAVDETNQHFALSNYGLDLSVMAPGVNIYSAQSGGGYASQTGTSFAVAYAAGLAAILKGLQPEAPPSSLYAYIEETALDLGDPGWDQYYGHGLIQMDAALLLARPPRSLPSSNPEEVVMSQPPLPHIYLTKYADSDVTSLNQTITWTIEATNLSDMPANHLEIDDLIPAELDILLIVPPESVTVNGNQVHWIIDILEPGKSRSLRVQTTFNQSAMPGTVCNSAYMREQAATDCVQVFPAELPPTGGQPMSLDNLSSARVAIVLAIMMALLWWFWRHIRSVDKL